MNFEMLWYFLAIVFVAMILVFLWGVKQMWSVNNKFLSFIFLLLAVASGVAGYAICWNHFFG